MSDRGVNLRGPYISVAKQFADGFDRYSLRKGNRRSEGMARRVEGNVSGDARQRHDPVEANVAPAVARQVENAFCAVHRVVSQQNSIRDRKDPHVDLRTGFATGRTYPHLFTLLSDVFWCQRAKVDIGKSRETTEQKGVAHQQQRHVVEVEPDKPSDFGDGKVVARHELAVQLVVGKKIRREIAPPAGQHEDVFECDHVNLRRVLFVPALLSDVLVETRQEFPVEVPERQVPALVFTADVIFEVVVNTPVFVIGRLAAAGADHPAKLLVVLPEKGQQHLAAAVVAEIHLLDHLRRDLRMFVK